MEVREVRRGQKGPQEARSQEQRQVMYTEGEERRREVMNPRRVQNGFETEQKRSGKAPFDSMKGQTSIEVRRIQRTVPER